MAQYQASCATADAEMNTEEAKFANSLIQYQHHAESSHRGYVTGRSFVQHDREKCHDRMMKDYFIERLRYSHDFRRRFQMRRELFESILNIVIHHDYYFARKIEVVGQQSLSPHHKLTSTFWILANGCSADLTDEYCLLADSTTIENLKRFCKAIEAIYGTIYLCKPNREDLKRLLHKADKRDFPDMIGSLDCMH
ncbi:uncharacterized protein [Malus domestica]|uniref:uncharacterized protein n=1 Tax=Malus domestica TaxID=3750 RepID=UPI0039771B3E